MHSFIQDLNTRLNINLLETSDDVYTDNQNQYDYVITIDTRYTNPIIELEYDGEEYTFQSKIIDIFFYLEKFIFEIKEKN